MKRTLRAIATFLVLVILLGVLPTVTVFSAVPPSPFLSTMYTDDNCIKDDSAKITSTETFGNGDVTLYGAQITSTGTRKSGASAQQTFNMKIATGSSNGRLFVYSKSSADGQGFANYSIKDIAAQFEADHPEWKVAVVTNASFFDNETSKTADVGEPEDIYVESGKVYKTYIEKGADGGDAFKVGRGIIGLKSDGSMIYHTIEDGTTNYNNANTNSTAYSFASKYTLEVLGENNNNSIYNYSLLVNAAFDYTGEPVFYTPNASARDLSGATVYKVKCSQYRRAHVSVNGREVGNKTYFFEGAIESIVSGTSSMQAPEGYVYIASYTPLEHLQVGVTVRGTKKLTGSWANVPYVFGFKQQILLEGEPLFDDALQESYGDTCYGSWNDWTEDVYYASYGTNRTAVGFKADGTPVIITSQRNPTGTTGSDTKESGVTYYEMAWYMKELGCVNAFMLDCGGSMGMYKKSTGSDTYEVACCEPLHTQPNRAVANALILAYPSGEAATPTDEKLADPSFNPGYITATTNPTWYTGVTKLRSTSEVKNSYEGDFSTNSTLSKTNFTLAQSGAIYTFTPKSTAFPSGYEAVYAYKKLGHTVEEGRKYTYCFKLHTVTAGKYTSFLFGEYPSNTSTSKMLNNFAVVGGAFSNNGDTQYSDVRAGVGRVQAGTSDVYGSNQNINLYLETVSSKEYSYYRIDIDGLNYTLKTKNSSGAWVQIGGTYTLPSGTQLVMGCASWEANTSRAMSVNDPVCVDITNLSNSIATANSLNSEEYTADSWVTLEAAKTKANYSVNLTYQKLVDFADTNLTTAINGLVKRMDIANANIAEYETANASLYTTASWANYQAAYQALVAAKESNDLASLDSLNTAYVAARNALVDAEISLDVQWNEMRFVYSAENASWNPDTHQYEGEIYWKQSQNSIGITNNSNVDVSVDLAFNADASFDELSGDFYIEDVLVEDNVVVPVDSSEEFKMKLDGSIPPLTENDTRIGTVTVTVSVS